MSRVSSDQRDISAAVAILSRELPLPSAQQLDGKTVTAKFLKTEDNGKSTFDIGGKTVTVSLPDDLPTPKPGQLLRLNLQMDTERGLQNLGRQSPSTTANQQTLNVQGNRASQSTSGNDKISNRDAVLRYNLSNADEKNSSTIDRLSTPARFIGALEASLKPEPARIQLPVDQSPLKALTSANNSTSIDTAQHEKSLATANPGLISDESSVPTTSQGLAQNPTATLSSKDPSTSMNLATLLSDDLSATSGAADTESSIQQLVKDFRATAAASQTDALPRGSPTAELARHVSSAIEHSGFFYESHLQQWLAGERSTEALQLEPQAQWSPEQSLQSNLLEGQQPLPASAKHVATQMHLIDQPRLQLTFPGLLNDIINIEIEPDGHRADTADSSDRAWVTRIRLNMPSLGTVDTAIRLIQNRLDIQIETEPDSKQAIDGNWRELEQALSNLGLTLNHGQVTIRSAESTKTTRILDTHKSTGAP